MFDKIDFYEFLLLIGLRWAVKIKPNGKYQVWLYSICPNKHRKYGYGFPPYYNEIDGKRVKWFCIEDEKLMRFFKDLQLESKPLDLKKYVESNKIL